MVLVDNGNRCVVHFLRTTLRLRNDGEGECINNQSQQHEIAHKATQFLGAEPEDIAEGLHRAPGYRSCFRSKNRLRSVRTGIKSANAARFVPRSSKPRPLVKVPTLTGK